MYLHTTFNEVTKRVYEVMATEQVSDNVPELFSSEMDSDEVRPCFLDCLGCPLPYWLSMSKEFHYFKQIVKECKNYIVSIMISLAVKP